MGRPAGRRQHAGPGRDVGGLSSRPAPEDVRRDRLGPRCGTLAPDGIRQRGCGMSLLPTRNLYLATTEADVAAAAMIISEAFSTLKASKWLISDPQERTAVLRDVFTILIAHAVEHGEVHLL